MSEQMRIEDAITETLTGETQNSALDFVAFLRANDCSVDWDGNWWAVHHKDECPALMAINSGGVKFGVLLNYCNFNEDTLKDDDLKETAWEHVQVCLHYESGGEKCGCGNQPGPIAVFGKVFNACRSPFTFRDPDAQKLTNIKKLVLLQLHSSTA